jgi:hypothetical protein
MGKKKAAGALAKDEPTGPPSAKVEPPEASPAKIEPPEAKVEPPQAPPARGDDPRAFYVVWSPQGGDPVRVIASFGEARRAAWRLAEKHPEKEFFVLRSCWGRRARPVEATGGPPRPVAPTP